MDKEKESGLDNGSSIWQASAHVSPERLEQLQREHIGFLRIRQVVELTSKSRSQIYRDASAGRFPKQVRISTNCTAWKAFEVFAWMESVPYVSNVNA